MMTPKFLASVDGSTDLPPIEKGGGAGRGVDCCLSTCRFVVVTMMVLLGGLSLTLLRMYQVSTFSAHEESELKADCCSNPVGVGLKLTLAWVSSENWSTVTPVTFTVILLIQWEGYISARPMQHHLAVYTRTI